MDISNLEKRVDRLEKVNDEVIRQFTVTMQKLNDTMENIQDTMVSIQNRLLESEKINEQVKDELQKLAIKVDKIEHRSLFNRLKSLLR